jgi:hypothetical protein
MNSKAVNSNPIGTAASLPPKKEEKKDDNNAVKMNVVNTEEETEDEREQREWDEQQDDYEYIDPESSIRVTRQIGTSSGTREVLANGDEFAYGESLLVSVEVDESVSSHQFVIETQGGALIHSSHAKETGCDGMRVWGSYKAKVSGGLLKEYTIVMPSSASTEEGMKDKVRIWGGWASGHEAVKIVEDFWLKGPSEEKEKAIPVAAGAPLPQDEIAQAAAAAATAEEAPVIVAAAPASAGINVVDARDTKKTAASPSSPRTKQIRNEQNIRILGEEMIANTDNSNGNIRGNYEYDLDASFSVRRYFIAVFIFFAISIPFVIIVMTKGNILSTRKSGGLKYY